MFVTARSPSFVSTRKGTGPGESKVVRLDGVQTCLPWFVMTYRRDDSQTSCWETICTARADDLLNHVKDFPKAYIAQLLYMAPPRQGTGGMWCRHQIRMIESGRCDSVVVSLFTDDTGHEFCFDAPHIEARLVTHRTPVLRVRREFYFD